MRMTRTPANRTKAAPRHVLIAGASLIAAACLTAGCGDDPQPAQEAPAGVDTAALQADMDALVDLGVPGIVVRVSEGDQSTTLTSGVSDLDAGTPLAAADRFRIGSVAKPYVAAVVMQLVDEGKLSLEDTVEEWLPGAVPSGDQITVRQLLQHQSGIADYGSDPEILQPYLEGDLDHVWTPQQLIEAANAQGPTSEPGTDISYSNTNYALVGLIIEEATGNSLGEALQTRIFDPLKLTETSFATDGKLEQPFARGYLVGQGKPIDATEVYPYYWGAGNIVADADDVAHFYDALLGGEVVPPELLDEMKDTIPEDPTVAQGLGLVSGELGCGVYYGHDGSAPGYFSAAYTFESGRQVVFLANSVAIDDTVAGPKAQKALAELTETACG